MIRPRSLSVLVPVILLVSLSLPTASPAQESQREAERRARLARCDLRPVGGISPIPGTVYWGTERTLTMERLASYVAPILWFSPDEPSLGGRAGVDVTVPEAFPFEEAAGPVLYYQLEEVVAAEATEGAAFRRDEADPAASLIGLGDAILLRLSYYAYFADEAGLGAHRHDVEPVEFKIVTLSSASDTLRGQGVRCDEEHFGVFVTRVSGKAHGIEWFWNIVEVDRESRFPMTLLVEEGKHALATDKNGDGYFTPAYDVNVRINDAWGVRDIIRSGGLFTGGYEAWMTKVRHPQHRVMPPLPEDSPVFPSGLERHPEYEGGNAVYELRLLPSTAVAAAWDEENPDQPPVEHFLADKEVPNAPEVESATELSQLVGWVEAGAIKKSLSAAFFADGNGMGGSWSFPFFVVKQLNLPMTGGYVLQRMYVTGDTFGWGALYSPSASRWLDGYGFAGAEWVTVYDAEGNRTGRTPYFVYEAGLKFRAQIGHSPLKFLTFLTDFWGVRAGIKNYGFADIDRLTYVLEVGAGSF